MTRLRFGILSTADIARRKVIPGMRTADRVEVVAIASRDADQAARVAAELGIPRSHGTYEAPLADPEVDAIYRLQAAGVRVPVPYNFLDGVLVMELVKDADGQPAPREHDAELRALLTA